MNPLKSALLILGFIGFSVTRPASAATGPDPHVPAPAEPPKPARPSIERLGEGRFRIGTILLDKTSQTLRIPANVNMREGMIELIACSSGGKLHESVFLANVEPYDLQIALLLLGLKAGRGARYQGDASRLKGDQVVIFVEEKKKQRRVEDYVWDKPRNKTMERTGWVFTGSQILDDGQFAAQLTRTLITTYHDPYTILDNPLTTGADDTVYEVNPRVTPPIGTTVTLVVRPLKAIKRKEDNDEAPHRD